MSRPLIPCLLALALASPAAAGAGGRYSERQILDAIRQVESGGRDDCPDGDAGRSIGPYQIQKPYWQDATAYDPSLSLDGTYQDCRKRGYAEKVIRAYMRRYVSAAWKRLDEGAAEIGDAEIIARTHNGGPRGAKKKSATEAYWMRVKAQLQKS